MQALLHPPSFCCIFLTDDIFLTKDICLLLSLSLSLPLSLSHTLYPSLFLSFSRTQDMYQPLLCTLPSTWESQRGLKMGPRQGVLKCSPEPVVAGAKGSRSRFSISLLFSLLLRSHFTSHLLSSPPFFSPLIPSPLLSFPTPLHASIISGLRKIHCLFSLSVTLIQSWSRGGQVTLFSPLPLSSLTPLWSLSLSLSLPSFLRWAHPAQQLCPAQT